jgi:hypothetical protein
LFLEGLLGDEQRKTGWMREAAGDPGPWRQQAILGRRDWDADALRDIVRNYVIEHLADELIMAHRRRQILWFGVTAHPTAEWIANQVTEAFGWEQAPCYLIRDRDRGPMGRHSFEGFDQWASAIDQRRRALHGRTDMLNGLSVRSDGSASITSSS